MREGVLCEGEQLRHNYVEAAGEGGCERAASGVAQRPNIHGRRSWPRGARAELAIIRTRHPRSSCFVWRE